MICLSKKWSDYLISQPETGMGYQIVDVTMKDGTVLKGLPVLGSEFLQFESSGYFMYDDSEIVSLEISSFNSLD